MVRLLLSMLVSLVLPPFLVHRMSTAEYSAWVLILQLSAYVNFLDLGLQTAISKFVAEYDAQGDIAGIRRILSSAFSLLSCGSAIGSIMVGVLAWQVPHLFHQMPASLVLPVRLGLLAIGLSTAISLPFGVFLSTFTGLQEYGFPTLLLSVSRVATAAALITALLLHATLFEMALLMAVLNLITALLQYVGWKLYASRRTGFQFFRIDRAASLRLVEYCGILTIWTLGTLLISGLDTTIVGHFDYANTGFYAVAGSATNFMLLLVGNLLGPLLPAISSLQVHRTASELGAIVIRTTRFVTVLLCLLGLPLLLGAYPLLTLWVGRNYAQHAVLYLDILVLANIVRQLSYPYALVVVALGKQRYATAAPVSEAIVNLAASVWLASRYGAAGAAAGTLIGAFVGLAVHFAISIPWTQHAIVISRVRLAFTGIVRPLVCTIPTLLLLPWLNRYARIPVPPLLLALWVFTTGALLWRASLGSADRDEVRHALERVLFFFRRPGRIVTPASS